MFRTSAVSRLLGVLVLATVLVGSTVGCLLLQPTGNEPIMAGEGWLTGWAKRVKLTIDQTDIDADLANFPVLLYLSTSSGRNAEDISFIFDELQSDANRLKIAVTTSDGTTECYVEVEKWDDANEQAWLWVKAPAVSGTVNTDLYLYYDSTHADNTAYVGDPESTPAMAVWNGNFKMIQHMRDYDTSHIHDSSTNNKDGTKKAANEPIVTTAGKIDDAQNFDGSDDVVTISYSTLIPIPLTLSAWIYDTGVSGACNIVQKANNFQFQTSPTNHQLIINYKDGIAWRSIITGNDVYYASTWHHVVATLEVSGSDTLGTFYVDGVQVYQATKTGQPTNYATITIGRYTTVAEPFKGKIDEVRISDMKRSASWIKASYETGRDHLLDWGSEETLNNPPYAPTLNTPAVGYRFNPSASVTFSWTFSDPDAGDYQTAYQFQLADNPGFSPTLIDTGKPLAWLAGWSYRKSHVISAAAGASTNYQVKSVVHYGSGADSGSDIYLSSHCRTDFGDVRFTDDDGTTLLDYWIESKTDSDNAVFWVEVADSLESDAQTIYIYYGKADATTTSNGVNTFIFFDDFDNLNQWTGDTSYASVSGGIMTWRVTVSAWKAMTTTATFPINSAIRTKTLFESHYDSQHTYTFQYISGSKCISMDVVIAGVRIRSYDTANNIQSSNWATGSYRIFDIKWISGNAAFIDNGAEVLNSPLTSQIPSVDMNIDYEGYNQYSDGRVLTDWILVRKYVSPEPAHGSWGSEEATPPQQTTQTLPSTVGVYYWHVKTWDSKYAEGPWSSGRTIIVDRIKIIACGILNGVVDTRTGGKVWYQAVYEADSTPLNGSLGTLYLNGSAMTWAIDRWTYAFSYSMSGSQAVFHITSVTEIYGLTTINNVAGDIVLNWATMEITISKP